MNCFEVGYRYRGNLFFLIPTTAYFIHSLLCPPCFIIQTVKIRWATLYSHKEKPTTISHCEFSYHMIWEGWGSNPRPYTHEWVIFLNCFISYTYFLKMQEIFQQFRTTEKPFTLFFLNLSATHGNNFLWFVCPYVREALGFLWYSYHSLTI